MGALGSYLNLREQGEWVKTILEVKVARSGRAPSRPRKKVYRQLDPVEIVKLLEAYQGGVEVGVISTQFCIDPVTIRRHVRRNGLAPRIDRASVVSDVEVARLYKLGSSILAIAQLMKVNPSTVSRSLDRSGVPIRIRGKRTAHEPT